MTEIVDERQRLVDRYTATLNLILGQAGIPDATEACRQIIRTAQSALASRPQEQPRKLASGGLIKRLRQHATELRDAVRDGNCTPDLNDEYLDNAADLDEAVAALAVSVSPAAAQGWQTVQPLVDIARTALRFTDSTVIVRGEDKDWKGTYVFNRAELAAIVAAAPPSPAAQEQENT